MRIPKRISVFGVLYSIRFIGQDEIGKDIAGTFNPETKQILLLKGMKQRDKEESFFHEYIHAILHECGATQGLDSGMEETISQAIGKNIAKFFHRRMH